MQPCNVTGVLAVARWRDRCPRWCWWRIRMSPLSLGNVYEVFAVAGWRYKLQLDGVTGVPADSRYVTDVPAAARWRDRRPHCRSVAYLTGNIDLSRGVRGFVWSLMHATQCPMHRRLRSTLPTLTSVSVHLLGHNITIFCLPYHHFTILTSSLPSRSLFKLTPTVMYPSLRTPTSIMVAFSTHHFHHVNLLYSPMPSRYFSLLIPTIILPFSP